MNRAGPLILLPPAVALVLATLALQVPPSRPRFAELDRCPAVASVEVILARGRSAKRIIHLLDRHYVSRERWHADLLDQDPWQPVPASAVKAREDAIVRNLLAAAQPNVVVVLGKAHDLREQLRRLSGGRCEYVMVAVRTGS